MEYFLGLFVFKLTVPVGKCKTSRKTLKLKVIANCPSA